MLPACFACWFQLNSNIFPRIAEIKGAALFGIHVLRGATHAKRGLSGQTLVHYSADAPQVGLGVVVLGHDDLGSLCAHKRTSEAR